MCATRACSRSRTWASTRGRCEALLKPLARDGTFARFPCTGCIHSCHAMSDVWIVELMGHISGMYAVRERP